MNQYDLGVLSKTNSWLRPVRREKILDGSSNFDDVSLKGKMPGVKELDASVRYVLSISLCASGNEERIILAPDREKRRLGFPKVILKRWIEFHVRGVIEKQIPNFLISLGNGNDNKYNN